MLETEVGFYSGYLILLLIFGIGVVTAVFSFFNETKEKILLNDTEYLKKQQKKLI